ncbi:MAG: DUF2145 domain-containing protein [Burkholderiales bacterium]|nr:DUF2145 domain-containing protein [Burkholderiales bacterium]
MTPRWLAPLLLSSLCLCGMARGGQDCGERAAPTPQALARGLALGERVRERLEAGGASAALVARVGLNLGEFGQRYTHMGVAVRDHVRRRWLALHLFNPCGKAESEITVQPLEQFYEVDLFEYEALVITPSYALQAALRDVFMNPATTRALHKPAYNMIAHPFSTRFQNSNQWILEMTAAALDRGAVKDRASAQAWLMNAGFEPGSIRIPNLRRAGARLFSPHVSFLDHTQEEYEKQAYLVITVDSIVRFLATKDPGLTQTGIR